MKVIVKVETKTVSYSIQELDLPMYLYYDDSFDSGGSYETYVALTEPRYNHRHEVDGLKGYELTIRSYGGKVDEFEFHPNVTCDSSSLAHWLSKERATVQEFNDALQKMLHSVHKAGLQPCRSPYCECEQGKCTHPGFYDARDEVNNER